MAKKQTAPVNLGNAIVPGRLKSFIERIERLDEERVAIAGDIRDVYSEAKGVGYDVKTIRKVVAIRKMDAADRDEQEALLDVYLHALGMVDRIEARAAAGESARQIAAAENVSKSTAARVSQKAKAKNGSAEMGRGETGSVTVVTTGKLDALSPDIPTHAAGGLERGEGIEPIVIGLEDRGSAIELVPQPVACSTAARQCLDNAKAMSPPNEMDAQAQPEHAPNLADEIQKPAAREECDEKSEVTGNSDGPRGDEAGDARGGPAARLFGDDGAERGEAGPQGDAGPGAERCEPAGWRAPEGAHAVRLAPTVSLGAVAEPSAAQRVADQDDLKIPAFLRGSAQ